MSPAISTSSRRQHQKSVLRNRDSMLSTMSEAAQGKPFIGEAVEGMEMTEGDEELLEELEVDEENSGMGCCVKVTIAIVLVLILIVVIAIVASSAGGSKKPAPGSAGTYPVNGEANKGCACSTGGIVAIVAAGVAVVLGAWCCCCACTSTTSEAPGHRDDQYQCQHAQNSKGAVNFTTADACEHQKSWTDVTIETDRTEADCVIPTGADKNVFTSEVGTNQKSQFSCCVYTKDAGSGKPSCTSQQFDKEHAAKHTYTPAGVKTDEEQCKDLGFDTKGSCSSKTNTDWVTGGAKAKCLGDSQQITSKTGVNSGNKVDCCAYTADGKTCGETTFKTNGDADVPTDASECAAQSWNDKKCGDQSSWKGKDHSDQTADGGAKGTCGDTSKITKTDGDEVQCCVFTPSKGSTAATCKAVASP